MFYDVLWLCLVGYPRARHKCFCGIAEQPAGGEEPHAKPPGGRNSEGSGGLPLSASELRGDQEVVHSAMVHQAIGFQFVFNNHFWMVA